MPELRARQLSKHFSGVRVVHDVSFTIQPGEIVGYLGPNGSGKTTTARMLAGLLEPSAGRVEYDSRDIREDLVAFRRLLGYIPEEPYLYPFLSGTEYLQLVGRLREIPERLIVLDDSFRFLRLRNVDEPRSECQEEHDRRRARRASGSEPHDSLPAPSAPAVDAPHCRKRIPLEFLAEDRETGSARRYNRLP